MYKATWVAFIFGLLVLAFLIVAPQSIADPVKGAKSWFQIPNVGSIQPSEYFKSVLILSLSWVAAKHQRKFGTGVIQKDLWLISKLLFVTGLPLFLIMLQPDLGTSLVYIAILLGIIFVSGVSYKLLVPFFAIVAGLASSVLYFVIWKPTLVQKWLGAESYQLGRIYAWLNPEKYKSDEAYQVYNSIMAISSGYVEGKGFNSGEVSIPEAHNDFIFSNIGEDYGFLGSSLIVILYFLLLYRIIRIALNSHDAFSTYICVGAVSMITFHVFENIGMTTGLLPTTGIPLPLLSYGGSSLLGVMLILGLVMNVKANTDQYMF